MAQLPHDVRYPGLVAALVVAGACFVVGLALRTAAGSARSTRSFPP